AGCIGVCCLKCWGHGAWEPCPSPTTLHLPSPDARALPQLRAAVRRDRGGGLLWAMTELRRVSRPPEGATITAPRALIGRPRPGANAPDLDAKAMAALILGKVVSLPALDRASLLIQALTLNPSPLPGMPAEAAAALREVTSQHAFIASSLIAFL